MNETTAAEANQRIKEQQVRHWNAVAAGWDAWLEWTERNFRPVTDWLLEAAGWTPGRRALDVACGAGYPALIGAARVQPRGVQVAVDISPAMVTAVSRRARAAGVGDLECAEMDAENLQFPDASFDTVTNAYGLMFCPDPQRAVNEACRVLKPGGRVALVTWDHPSKSPFFTVIASAMESILSLATVEAGAPGPFRLSDAALLHSMLQAGGLRDVHIESRPAIFEVASVSEYFQLFSDVALKRRLAALSGADRARLEAAISKAAQPFITSGRLRLTATSLCVSARKHKISSMMTP